MTGELLIGLACPVACIVGVFATLALIAVMGSGKFSEDERKAAGLLVRR